MKATFIILFVCCWASNLAVFGQKTIKRNLRDKETLEIAYIVDQIKANKSADSLTVWKSSSEYKKGEHEYVVPFEYRSRLAFFEIRRNPEGAFLKAIFYDRSSLHKVIYPDDAPISREAPTSHEVDGRTRFGVWMSKDRLSIYFGMINPDKVIIWVFTSEASVYAVQHKISE